jgi:hypothetical protein
MGDDKLPGERAHNLSSSWQGPGQWHGDTVVLEAVAGATFLERTKEEKPDQMHNETQDVVVGRDPDQKPLGIQFADVGVAFSL